MRRVRKEKCDMRVRGNECVRGERKSSVSGD